MPDEIKTSAKKSTNRNGILAERRKTL